jgi:hypothetical protein
MRSWRLTTLKIREVPQFSQLSTWHPLFQKAVKRRKSRRECQYMTDVFDTQVDENFL